METVTITQVLEQEPVSHVSSSVLTPVVSKKKEQLESACANFIDNKWKLTSNILNSIKLN